MSQVQDIAIQCAPFLKGHWRYSKKQALTGYRQRAVIQDDTKWGRHIILSDCYRVEGRVQATGSLPGSRYPNHSITFSPSRSISALSADINRRFLPEYLKEWDKAEKLENEQVARTEDLRIRVNVLKRIAPYISPVRTYANEVATDYYIKRGTLRLSPYNTTASINVSLSFEQLVKVLHILKDGE